VSEADAPAAPTRGWSAGDWRGLLVLAGVVGLSWAGAAIATSSGAGLDGLTWMPLLRPTAYRLAVATVALVIVVQLVRHWRAPDPRGDVETISFPTVRAMAIGAAVLAMAAAGDWMHERAAGRRAERFAEERSAALDAGEQPSQLTLVDGFDGRGWRAWRRDVGAQDDWRWHRRREAVWVESREGRAFEEKDVWARTWRREFVSLGRETHEGRWFLLTTTWCGDPPSWPAGVPR